MRVAIIGGKLQGVEATYLAKKAGWEVVLFDRRERAQATGLTDMFHCLDILTSAEEVIACMAGIDLIIPAIEDAAVLQALAEIARITQIPLAFDSAAYAVSSSKCISNRLFSALDVPSPRPWPECQFPLLLKPSGQSGSKGVHIIHIREELDHIRSQNIDDDWIIEEYLDGPAYSIEVFGFAGKYRVFQITETEMDRVYDCKRVLAPTALDYRLMGQFEEIALKIASELSLNGIMDVEAILHDGKLKVLEIDARIPSQTPTAVYHSSGINMVECLGYSFVQESLYIPIPKRPRQNERFVIYEHCKVTSEKIEVSGEHILAEAGPLKLVPDFFGADEALTDYTPGKKDWVLTLITRGTSPEDAWDKRDSVLERIQMAFNIPEILDPYPPGI
ncbi:3-methylornithine--L-lysine ligase PylC [Sporomusa malonica]|uniref:Pyrrolysine biosynthesis protein PylC n=1 Tax=Sporomusa malonica TaxID=112901 RepID=A0A1W1YHN3_9FIRM|nr:3-methylornithine--L-lysine ligase PylC [Sporomusa malonica]SMC35740.1 pyrrolysine biosynthesis protein PylC [Sporomusa malonica]